MDKSENARMQEPATQSNTAASSPETASEHAVPSPTDEGSSQAAGMDDGTAMHAGVATDATGEAPAAGVLLARARERMGLSVGEVANHLKLSIRQVEALEADAFERLPSPMFIRGFARSYSRLLQVDPAPVMQALDRRFPPPPAGVVAPAGVAAGLVRQPVPSAIPFPSADRPSRRLHSAAGLLAAVVVGFLAFEFFGPATVPQGTLQGVVRDPATEVVQSGVPREQPPAAGAAGEGAVGTDAAGTPAGDAATAVPAAAPVPPPATLATPVGASSTALSEIGDAFGTGPRTVRLSFDRESWVEIRDARGRLIFSQLNPPGSSQEVQGEPPLSLVVGNARSVRLAYGGRDIDLAPHTRVDVARFTLD